MTRTTTTTKAPRGVVAAAATMIELLLLLGELSKQPNLLHASGVELSHGAQITTAQGLILKPRSSSLAVVFEMLSYTATSLERTSRVASQQSLRWSLVLSIQTYLEGVSTGEEEDDTEFNQSIDSWIEVVDQDAGVLRTKKRAAGELDKDTEDSLLVCRDLL
jgi:hypothetical protein